MFSYIWKKIKSWSGWSAAGSIFLARLTALSGIVLAGLQGINWPSLMATDWSNVASSKAALISAGIAVAYGAVLEITRRHNATDL